MAAGLTTQPSGQGETFHLLNIALIGKCSPPFNSGVGKLFFGGSCGK